MLAEEQRDIAAVLACGFQRLSEGRTVDRGMLQRLARITAEPPDADPASEVVWQWVYALKRDFPR